MTLPMADMASTVASYSAPDANVGIGEGSGFDTMSGDRSGGGGGSSGSGGSQCHSILAWNPSTSELPPSSQYPADVHLQASPNGGWDWNFTAPSGTIKDAYVAPTIHSNPYLLGTSSNPLDYNGDVCAYSNAFVHFTSPGVYAIKVDYENPTLTDYIEFVHPGAPGPAGDAGNPDQAVKSRYKEATLPFGTTAATASHVWIIEDATADNGFLPAAAQVVTGEVRVTSVAAAIQAVNTAYANNGNQPVDVTFAGHGLKSRISVGDGQTTLPGKYLESNDASVQSFTTQLKGKVNRVALIGCNVADDLSSPTHLMKSLSTGLSTTQHTVTVYSWDANMRAVVPGPRRTGYFAVDTSGTMKSYP